MNIDDWIKERGFDVHGGCPGREPQMAIKESDLHALFEGKVLVPATAPVQNASRYYPSLTKREQFAMAAMQGLCSKEGAYHRPEHLALDAVNQADAVLAALSAMPAKVQP